MLTNKEKYKWHFVDWEKHVAKCQEQDISDSENEKDLSMGRTRKTKTKEKMDFSIRVRRGEARRKP